MPGRRKPHTTTARHQRWRDNAVRAQRKLKEEMLKAYGGRCALCLNDNKLVLVIDHVHDNGYQRRHSGQDKTGIALYRQLRSRGWPREYQLLCANCNLHKERLRAARASGQKADSGYEGCDFW